jgi:nucleoside-diphosphate-sugar epimerase
MILVTGGTGFIGGHLLDRLTETGLRWRQAKREHFANPDALKVALDGVDTVIHLAGATKALSARGYYEVNVGLTEALVRPLVGGGVRVVHVSSLAAAGPGAQGKPIDETVEPHPISNYGKSKLEAERVVRDALSDAVIVRPPVVYGPRETGVFQILKSISRGFALEIGGGDRWFSHIYVRDLVEGLIAAARSPQAAGRTYFMAYPKPASWRELAQSAAEIMHSRPRVWRVPLAAARGVGFAADCWATISRRPATISRDKVAEAQCNWWVCDSARACQELGFRAPTSLDEGLEITLAWYKEAGWVSY